MACSLGAIAIVTIWASNDTRRVVEKREVHAHSACCRAGAIVAIRLTHLARYTTLRVIIEFPNW